MVLGCISRYFRDPDTRQELLQEVFIKVFTALPRLKDPRTCEAWIRQIALNHCIDRFRQNKNLFTATLNEDLTESETDAEEADEDISMEQILEAVENLPEGYRMVFNLFAVDQLSHKEIAERLNISVSTSKTQYLKARRMIRQLVIKKKSDAKQL